MSIIGAMGAGVAISGIVIKFQKSVYDSKIAELQGYATELDGHLATLESYKNEVPGFWGDDAGQKYVAQIDKQIQQIRTARTRIDDLSKLYDSLKGALDSAKSQVSTKVDEISSIVGALSGLSE